MDYDVAVYLDECNEVIRHLVDVLWASRVEEPVRSRVLAAAIMTAMQTYDKNDGPEQIREDGLLCNVIYLTDLLRKRLK